MFSWFNAVWSHLYSKLHKNLDSNQKIQFVWFILQRIRSVNIQLISSKTPELRTKNPLAIPRALSNKFFSLLHWVFQCCGLFMLDLIIFRCYQFRYSVTTQHKFFLVDFWYHESINGWSKQDNVFQFHQYKWVIGYDSYR